METCFFAEWFLLLSLFSHFLNFLPKRDGQVCNRVGQVSSRSGVGKEPLHRLGCWRIGAQVLPSVIPQVEEAGGPGRITVSGRKSESKFMWWFFCSPVMIMMVLGATGGLRMEAAGQKCWLASDALRFPKSFWMAFSVSGTWFPLKKLSNSFATIYNSFLLSPTQSSMALKCKPIKCHLRPWRQKALRAPVVCESPLWGLFDLVGRDTPFWCGFTLLCDPHLSLYFEGPQEIRLLFSPEPCTMSEERC